MLIMHGQALQLCLPEELGRYKCDYDQCDHCLRVIFSNSISLVKLIIPLLYKPNCISMLTKTVIADMLACGRSELGDFRELQVSPCRDPETVWVMFLPAN